MKVASTIFYQQTSQLGHAFNSAAGRIEKMKLAWAPRLSTHKMGARKKSLEREGSWLITLPKMPISLYLI